MASGRWYSMRVPNLRQPANDVTRTRFYSGSYSRQPCGHQSQHKVPASPSTTRWPPGTLKDSDLQELTTLHATLDTILYCTILCYAAIYLSTASLVRLLRLGALPHLFRLRPGRLCRPPRKTCPVKRRPRPVVACCNGPFQ